MYFIQHVSYDNAETINQVCIQARFIFKGSRVYHDYYSNVPYPSLCPNKVSP